MKTRGKILREPNAAPGLLMIEGQQFWFSREASWKSDVPPKPGLVVEVDLDRNLQVIAVMAIPESQLEAEALAAVTREPTRRTKQRGMLSRFCSWFFGHAHGEI